MAVGKGETGASRKTAAVADGECPGVAQTRYFSIIECLLMLISLWMAGCKWSRYGVCFIIRCLMAAQWIMAQLCK